MRQTTLPASWISDAEEVSSSESSYSDEDVAPDRGKPLQWTRVKSLQQIKSQRVMVYNAVEDLKFDRNLKVIRKEMDHQLGHFFFDPEDFKDIAASFDEESYRLPTDGLLEYAKLASKLRRQFEEKAEVMMMQQVEQVQQEEEKKVRIEPKLYRGKNRQVHSSKPIPLMLGFEAKDGSRRLKKQKKKDLSLDELAEIVRLVKEKKMTQREVAFQFDVKPSFITSLIKNEKLGKNSVSMLKQKQVSKQERRQTIRDCIDKHIKDKWHIWTTQQIREAMVQIGCPDVKNEEVRVVLREDYKMSYRVLKKAAYQGNSQRCLVTRMLYAKKMFELLDAGKRIINIDETWLPHLDFRNKKWRRRGEPNTMSTKQLSPKVNMIAAIDTEGNLYLSLTQQNTDNDVMLMFFSRLANVLSQESQDWRDNTYWLLDNAAYHRSRDVRDCLMKLGVKVVLSGQYAYNAAPCELFFSYYKREDQNPTRIKTSKTNAVALVYDRIKSLHQPSFILFWRQAILGLYGYLTFRRN